MQAIGDFAERRLQEPRGDYEKHLRSARWATVRLMQRLKVVDADNPDASVIRGLAADRMLFTALRYIAGPPISADDLGVLVTRTTERLTRTSLARSERLASDVLRLICGLADSSRFPWIASRRKPSGTELRYAVRATAAAMAAQAMQTERRGHGRKVEQAMRDRLITAGFSKVVAANSGRIDNPTHHPRARCFFGECTLRGRRTDLLIGLADGRAVAVEAKDSGSAVNSVKRVLNDTAAKARHWQSKCGEDVISVALLSGVFKVADLESAQRSGLFLVFAHDLEGFVAWLDAR
jgi:hypothetical protein